MNPMCPPLSFVRRLLLITTCSLAATSAMAAPLLADGFDPDLITLVKVGMTKEEVQQALGRPARSQYYWLSRSTTWTYDVDPVSAEQIIFDVDFDTQGRVAGSSERRLPTP